MVMQKKDEYPGEARRFGIKVLRCIDLDGAAHSQHMLGTSEWQYRTVIHDILRLSHLFLSNSIANSHASPQIDSGRPSW